MVLAQCGLQCLYPSSYNRIKFVVPRVVDTNTNTVIGTIPTDPSPGPVAVNPFTNRIYVATSFQPQDVVDIIDGNTRQIINRLPVEPSPADSVIDLVHHSLYIASPNFLLDVPGGNVTTVIDTRP